VSENIKQIALIEQEAVQDSHDHEMERIQAAHNNMVTEWDRTNSHDMAAHQNWIKQAIRCHKIKMTEMSEEAKLHKEKYDRDMERMKLRYDRELLVAIDQHTEVIRTSETAAVAIARWFDQVSLGWKVTGGLGFLFALFATMALSRFMARWLFSKPF